MTVATTVLTTDQEAQREAFAERLLGAVGGVIDIFTLYLGEKLGFYEALAEYGALSSAALARLTGTHERYVREWCEQQTVSGILTVEHLDGPAAERCFRLSDAYAEVLLDTDSPYYVGAMGRLAAGAVRPLEKLVEAYRTGEGVPYSEYGADFREGQGDINRPVFLHELGESWLPSIPDVHARLQSNPPARVADIGCGFGWSTIGIAKTYPNVRVDGYDMDDPSIEAARANKADFGINGRVSFHTIDVSELDMRAALAGHYDLVTAFECVHDMGDPVGALRTMYEISRPDGTVLIADERVGDEFTPGGNDVEWMMYGWSVLHCLPVGLADEHSVGTGTVMRRSTLEGYAREAGFSAVEVLPIENFFFRVYRLHK